jgi:hypothetical protein
MPSSPHLAPSARLLDQVRERIRVKHYSIRTEQAYTVHFAGTICPTGRFSARCGRQCVMLA